MKNFYRRRQKNNIVYYIIIIILILLTVFVLEQQNFISNIKKIHMNNQNDKLPVWNLADLYKNINSDEINADIKTIDNMVKNFQSYKEKITSFNEKQLLNSIIEYENILTLLSKLSSYAYLKYSENLSIEENVKFYQKINEKITDVSSKIVFFTLEISQIDSNVLKFFYKNSKELYQYKTFIDNIILYKRYRLNEDIEKILIEKRLSGANAWIRLFDELTNNMVFKYKDKTYNQSEFLMLMNDKDEKVRAETSKIFGETLAKEGKLFALITNTLAVDKSIDDKLRGFKTPISSRNLSNLIDDKVVETLRNTVIKNYKNTSHRYYKWKAKELKKTKLHYYDRNAPLPYFDNKIYTWDEARNIVLKSYKDFSVDMYDIGKIFFDNNWIDVPTRQGKMSGGYMMPTIPSIHPYIMLNYQGKTRDVMTLAHELGHGIHQVLLDKHTYLSAHAPLTLAETASVFGEQLTFKKILALEKNKQQKKAILANKIEDMINTVVRQIAFLEFETIVHNERKHGEIPLDRLNEIWLQVQYDSLGKNNFIFDDEYKNYWMYIPHFIHSPFYVYSYAFGECLVNSLYSIYLQNPKDFEKKYIEFLKNSSTVKYDVLLKKFNLDPKKEEFWQNGIDVLIKMIDELESM